MNKTTIFVGLTTTMLLLPLTTFAQDGDRMERSERNELKVPKNVSDECKIALQSAMDAQTKENATKKLENQSAIAALIKEKRSKVRALEDKNILSKRALEDAMDDEMGKVTTVAERSAVEKKYRKQLETLNKDFQKSVKAIEQDYHKQLSALVKVNTATKPTLPDSCKTEQGKLGAVKGAFTVRK